MRRLPCLLAILLAASALPDAASAQGGSTLTDGCGPRGETLSQTPTTRVYRRAGRTFACTLRVDRPLRLGKARPGQVAIARGTVAVSVGSSARSVDVATGRTLRRLRAPGRITRLLLRGGGSLAVQSGATVLKADGDWPRRQTLATDALPRTLRQGASRAWDLSWRTDPQNAYVGGGAYLVDTVTRCDAKTLATDGGFTLGSAYGQYLMCPSDRPERTTLVYDDRLPAGELGGGGQRDELLLFRAGTAVFRSTQLDRTNTSQGASLAIYRLALPGLVGGIEIEGATDTAATVRVLGDDAGRLVIALRRGTPSYDPQPVEPRILVSAPGDTRTIDAGPGVDPESLRLDGTVASWTRGGVVQTFDLAQL